jgi:hypothetical protein
MISGWFFHSRLPDTLYCSLTGLSWPSLHRPRALTDAYLLLSQLSVPYGPLYDPPGDGVVGVGACQPHFCLRWCS